MTHKIITGVLAVLTLLFAVLPTFGATLFGGASGQQHRQYESFLQGLGGGGRDQFSVSNTGAVTAKSLNVTTSNTATSTSILGCIQSYATSTASPVYLTFSAYAGTTTTQGGTSNFLVAAKFGSCPK